MKTARPFIPPLRARRKCGFAGNARHCGHRVPAVLEWKSEPGAQRAPTPAIPAPAVAVAVRITPEVIAARIADRSASTREKRAAAARFLCTQGSAAALPVLKEASKRCAQDGPWWINTVIEKIERDLKR